jgi:hypothetical protein
MMFKHLTIAFLFVCSSLVSVAQTTPPKVEFEDKDDDIMQMEFDLNRNRPFVEPIGGMANYSYLETSDIENSISYGGILGFRYTRKVKESSILRDDHNSFYLLFQSAGDATPTTYSISSFRFGFSSGESYGYAFNHSGNEGLYLGYSKAPLSWYTVNVDSAPNNGQRTESLRYFEESLRFGEASTALIGIRVAEPVTLNVGFEWAQIYERHLFWYWAMSQIIEGAADGLATWFVRSVGASSPTALPIMHFLLRNGVAMGFKALRMEQMNWPFTTAAPINSITYRIGLSANF